VLVRPRGRLVTRLSFLTTIALITLLLAISLPLGGSAQRFRIPFTQERTVSADHAGRSDRVLLPESAGLLLLGSALGLVALTLRKRKH